MKKVPICLKIDDPAPVISVYHEHAKSPTTRDGRPLISTYPNSFLFSFCDLMEQYGLKGKFSVVPMPGNKGDIVNGLDGVDPKELTEWLDTVRTRVAKNFSLTPEMLTHHKAIDLATGKVLDVREDDFSATQDRATLTPYVAKALSILKEARIHTIGITSPWSFGIKVEEEYEKAISQAVYDVTGSKKAWFFLRERSGVPNAKPWIAREEDGRVLVAIPATTRDHIWQTMDTTEDSAEYVSSVADLWITEDGKDGEIIRILETGGYPIMITHWQSLISNGSGVGLRVLKEVARRIETHLLDRVEWMTCDEIMELVLANPEEHPKPCFD